MKTLIETIKESLVNEAKRSCKLYQYISQYCLGYIDTEEFSTGELSSGSMLLSSGFYPAEFKKDFNNDDKKFFKFIIKNLSKTITPVKIDITDPQYAKYEDPDQSDDDVSYYAFTVDNVLFVLPNGDFIEDW